MTGFEQHNFSAITSRQSLVQAVGHKGCEEIAGSRGMWGRKDLLGDHETGEGGWGTQVWRGVFKLLFALKPLTLCRTGSVPPGCVVWNVEWA